MEILLRIRIHAYFDLVGSCVNRLDDLIFLLIVVTRITTSGPPSRGIIGINADLVEKGGACKIACASHPFYVFLRLTCVNSLKNSLLSRSALKSGGEPINRRPFSLVSNAYRRQPDCPLKFHLTRNTSCTPHRVHVCMPVCAYICCKTRITRVFIPDSAALVTDLLWFSFNNCLFCMEILCKIRNPRTSIFVQ